MMYLKQDSGTRVPQGKESIKRETTSRRSTMEAVEVGRLPSARGPFEIQSLIFIATMYMEVVDLDLEERMLQNGCGRPSMHDEANFFLRNPCSSRVLPNAPVPRSLHASIVLMRNKKQLKKAVDSYVSYFTLRRTTS